ncbi:MAG: 2-deoxy-D-gluconate 3-dehydrogenase [Rubritepida sp.]|nr:2-deoxy-D-gluconate 3-dehydrogenase [Rubritepida sp.]
MFDLGRVALVIGAIGPGLAKGLGACGARVVVTGRDTEKNAAALKELGGNTHAIAADLARPGETDRVLAETLATRPVWLAAQRHVLGIALALIAAELTVGSRA